MALGVSVPGSVSDRSDITVSLTGGSAATAYVIKIIDPGGVRGYEQTVTTDGSGNGSVTFHVPHSHFGGTWNVEVRPQAEYLGKTTASATTTFTTSRNGG